MIDYWGHEYKTQLLSEMRDLELRVSALQESLQEFRTALVRLDELSRMLGYTLRMTRVGWDCWEGEFNSETVLKPINQIAKQIDEAIPEEIKVIK